MITLRTRGAALAATVWVVAFCSYADPDEFASLHDAAVATNPSGLTLSLGTELDEYRIGEEITVLLESSNVTGITYVAESLMNNISHDHNLMIHVDGPDGGHHHPAPFVFETTGWNGPGWRLRLGTDSEIKLGSRVRFDTPGDYRLFITLFVHPHGDREATQPLHSSLLHLRLLPMTGEQEGEILGRARKLFEERKERQGCWLLRNLATPAAIEMLLELTVDTTWDWPQFAVAVGARDRAHAISRLRDRLEDPQGVVSRRLIDALARLSSPQIDPPYDPLATLEQNGQRLFNAATLWFDERQARKDEVTAWLASSLSHKSGRALVYAVSVLSRTVEATPELRRAVAGVFPSLTVQEQANLLASAWYGIESPELETVLVEMLSRPPANAEASAEGQLRSIALRRLSESRPELARRFVLEDLRRESPILSLSLLRELDPPPPADVQATLVTHLELNPGSRVLAMLVEHYASSEHLPRIIALQPSILDGNVRDSLLRYRFKHERITFLNDLVERDDPGKRAWFAVSYIISQRWGDDVEAWAIDQLSGDDWIHKTHLARTMAQNASSSCAPELLDLLDRSANARPEDRAETRELEAVHETIRRALLSSERGWDLTATERERLFAHLRSADERKRYEVVYGQPDSH